MKKPLIDQESQFWSSFVEGKDAPVNYKVKGGKKKKNVEIG